MTLAGKGDGAFFTEVKRLIIDIGIIAGYFLWVVFACRNIRNRSIGRLMLA